MPTRRKRPMTPQKRFMIKLWFIFLAFVVFIFYLDFRIRPTIKTMSAYQARVFSGRVINEAIINELNRENVNYNSLVTLTRNSDGNISALQTDMVELNKLRSNIVTEVIKSLDGIAEQEINIPFGSLTGVQVFSGRGPQVTFRIVPTGYIETKLENKFLSAGINQTQHQIMLNIDLVVTAIIPGYTTSTQVTSNFCLAETVIVGTVPEAFTEVTGSEDITSKIFDYGAERNFTIDRTPQT